jgi:hypothetical protein
VINQIGRICSTGYIKAIVEDVVVLKPSEVGITENIVLDRGLWVIRDCWEEKLWRPVVRGVRVGM